MSPDHRFVLRYARQVDDFNRHSALFEYGCDSQEAEAHEDALVQQEARWRDDETNRKKPASAHTCHCILEPYLHVHTVGDVNAVDEPDLVRVVLHDHRAGADAVAEEADSPHQRAVGHSSGRENDARPWREILRAIDLLEIGNAHRATPLLILGLSNDEPRE